jgi:hypothetical protein
MSEQNFALAKLSLASGAGELYVICEARCILPENYCVPVSLQHMSLF